MRSSTTRLPKSTGLRSSTIMELFKKKSKIKIESKDDMCSLQIPLSSFATIQSQAKISDDMLPEIVDLLVIEQFRKTVLRNESQIVIGETDEQMLNMSYPFYMKYFADDTTQSRKPIKISNEDIRFILQQADIDWMDFLNYIIITISEEIFSTEKTTKKKRAYDKRYEMLFKLIKIFQIEFSDKDLESIEITIVSLKKIMNMLDLDATSIIPFVRLALITYRAQIQTIAARKRSILYNRSTLLLGLQNENEEALIVDFTSGERGNKLNTLPFDNLENVRDLASTLLKDLIDKVNIKKEKILNLIKDTENNGHSLIKCKDDTGNEILLRTRLVNLIKNDTNEYYDKYIVEDYDTKKKVYLNKTTIDFDKYIEMIEIIDERNQHKLVVDKNELKTIYESFTYNNKEVIVNNKHRNNQGNYTIRLIQTSLCNVDLKDCEMIQDQPEEQRLIKAKSSAIEHELNSNCSQIELVELGEGRIVLKDLITKLKLMNYDLQYYMVNNSYYNDTNTKMKITKEEIIKEYKSYVSITNSQSQIVLIEKSKLMASLSQWNKLSQIFTFNDNKGKENIINLYQISIKKYSPSDIPVQIAYINQNLKKDLKCDYYYCQGKDSNNSVVYVRMMYINQINSSSMKYPKYFVKDNTYNDIFIADLEDFTKNKMYIEIFNEEDNKNYLIPVDDIEKALKDTEGESFETADHLSNPITLKKISIKIIQQKPVELDEQPQAIKDSILSQIEDEFVEIKNIKDQSYHIVRMSKLQQVINHKQVVLFSMYQIEDNDHKKIYVTKQLCNDTISSSNSPHYILCKNKSTNTEHYLNIEDVKEIDKGLEEEAQIRGPQSTTVKIQLKYLQSKKLDKITELQEQPEEEFMKKIKIRIAEINSITKDSEYIQLEATPILILKHYMDLVNNDQTERQEIEVLDSNSNKILLSKHAKVSHDIYYKICDNNSNSIYFSTKESLYNSLTEITSSDESLSLHDYYSKKEYILSPLHYTLMTEDISTISLPPYIKKEVIFEPVIIPVTASIIPNNQSKPFNENNKQLSIEKNEEILNIIDTHKIQSDIAKYQPYVITKPPRKSSYLIHRVVVKKIKKTI